MSITIEKLKVGDRVLEQETCNPRRFRCIVKEINSKYLILEIIEVDRLTDGSPEIQIGVDLCPEQFDEWGVTKRFKGTYNVTIDLDCCDVDEPDEEAMQNGLDRAYDGAMYLTLESCELCETEQNELPDTPETRQAKIDKLLRQITEFPEILKQIKEGIL